ncbi:hypothetical protein OKW35_003098 [Paraburkholderia sp. MM5477-R1]
MHSVTCGNRHCPKCQSLARAQWLEDRQADLLPVPYFHVVFTIPEEIASVAFQNKRVVYDILFQATAETLQTIASDPRHLGATIGFIAILHTWGQNLVHHPHLHCVVPGGGLAPDGSRWVGSMTSCGTEAGLPQWNQTRVSIAVRAARCGRAAPGDFRRGGQHGAR